MNDRKKKRKDQASSKFTPDNLFTYTSISNRSIIAAILCRTANRQHPHDITQPREPAPMSCRPLTRGVATPPASRKFAARHCAKPAARRPCPPASRATPARHRANAARGRGKAARRRAIVARHRAIVTNHRRTFARYRARIARRRASAARHRAAIPRRQAAIPRRRASVARCRGTAENTAPAARGQACPIAESLALQGSPTIQPCPARLHTAFSTTGANHAQELLPSLR